MFTFFLKKNFCDGWDNFFFLILSNILPIALGAGIVLGIKFTGQINPYLPYAIIIIGAGLFGTVLFMSGAASAKIADFDAANFKTYFASFPYVWKTGFLFGAICALGLAFILFGVRYYLNMFFGGNYIGMLFTAVLGWFTLISAAALQWFVPLYFLQDDNGFSKCLKKSFIIFFDNASFSIGTFIYNILLTILSCITLFLIPGISGLSLSSMNALRLRLYKYDWIEKNDNENPGFINDRNKRDEVPWDELLKEDRETLGPRNFSSFIFPWK